MNSVNVLVASNLRAEIARQKVTQKELCQLLGVSRSALTRRLSGTVPIDVNELVVFADYLDVPVVELLPAKAAS